MKLLKPISTILLAGFLLLGIINALIWAWQSAIGDDVYSSVPYSWLKEEGVKLDKCQQVGHGHVQVRVKEVDTGSVIAFRCSKFADTSFIVWPFYNDVFLLLSLS